MVFDMMNRTRVDAYEKSIDDYGMYLYMGTWKCIRRVRRKLFYSDPEGTVVWTTDWSVLAGNSKFLDPPDEEQKRAYVKTS
jgi:hypothetical protein